MRADVVAGYYMARYARERDLMEFMAYVTDCLYWQGRGMAPKTRWVDAVRPREPEHTDPQEVLDYLVERGGVVIE